MRFVWINAHAQAVSVRLNGISNEEPRACDFLDKGGDVARWGINYQPISKTGDRDTIGFHAQPIDT